MKKFNLKDANPCRWWNIINKISGRSANVTPISYEDAAGNVISGNNLAKRLNEFRPHRNFHHDT